MTSLIFPRTEAPTLGVAGSEARYPIRHVFCVTRNYDARAANPGGFKSLEEPAIFTKQSSAVVGHGARIAYPPATSHVEPELELVVVLGARVSQADVDAAKAAIFGYAVGLDMTRRDLQRAARAAGKPWDTAKWFEGCSPISDVRRAADIGHPARGAITLDVNGRRAQAGDLAQMMWTAPEVVALVSRYVTLAPGDVIFTGTPAGEIAVTSGDRLHGAIDGVGTLDVTIGDAEG
ncbi:MAG: fumarylacetoacetate hydrolase family protein [Gemmatimonas sp.]